MRKNPIIITTILIFLLIFPYPVHAGFLRNFANTIKRTSRFIINLPDKSTRFLGPVLGPIAADLLTQNILSNPRIARIFRHAQRIDKFSGDLSQQQKILDQVKADLRSQASELKNQAYEIRQLKNELSQNLLKGEISLSDYQDKVISLDQMANSYDRAADKFNLSADRIKPENLIKIVSRNAFNQMIKNIRSGVEYQVTQEINRFIKPDFINNLISRGDLSFDQIIDMLISVDIASIIGDNKDFDTDEFRNCLRDKIKEIYQNDKNNLKNNWRAEVDNAIKQIKKDLETEKQNLVTPESTPITPEKAESDTNSNQEENDDRCPSGYEFCSNCGVDCRQKNCNDITYGHWSYTGRCICGSAGSINENPDDPNKGCYYPNTYESCPDCLYQCIHTNQNCPVPKPN